MLDPKIFIRNWVETYLDNIVKDPQLTEKTAKSMFRKLGIEASLDAVLCYIVGMCTGSIAAYADGTEYNRDDLTIEIMEIVYRRILEIKEIMLTKRLFDL